MVEDELNVDVVEAIDELSDVLTYELVPNFKLLGPRLGPAVQQLRAAMGSVDGAAAAAAWPPVGRWWSSWTTDRSS